MTEWYEVQGTPTEGGADIPVHKFTEEYPFVEGTLRAIETNVGPNGSTMYTLEREDGTQVKVWGSTVIDDRMKGVKEGSLVKIAFEGMKYSERTKRSYKVFKVFTATPPADGPAGD